MLVAFKSLQILTLCNTALGNSFLLEASVPLLYYYYTNIQKQHGAA